MPAQSPRSRRDVGVKLRWPRDHMGDPLGADVARSRQRAAGAGTDAVTAGSMQILLEEYAQEIVAAVESVTVDAEGRMLTQVRRLSKAVDEMAVEIRNLTDELTALRRRVQLRAGKEGEEG